MINHFYISADDPPSKQEILKAALKLFVRDGIRETNIRAIATEAGYTNPALFKFFKSKEALALHLFEKCYLEFSIQIDAALPPKCSFTGKLRSLLEVFGTFLNENPEAFLFVHEQLRDYWPKVSARVKSESMIQKVRQLIRQGVDEGHVRKDVRLDLLVAAVVGFLLQFARMSYFGEFKGSAEKWTNELEQVCRAIVEK